MTPGEGGLVNPKFRIKEVSPGLPEGWWGFALSIQVSSPLGQFLPILWSQPHYGSSQVPMREMTRTVLHRVKDCGSRSRSELSHLSFCNYGVICLLFAQNPRNLGLKGHLQSSVSPALVPRFSKWGLWPAASASPGNLLKMQILKTCPRPSDQKVWNGALQVILIHKSAWEPLPLARLPEQDDCECPSGKVIPSPYYNMPSFLIKADAFWLT